MCYALNSVTCYDFTVLYIGISRRLLGTCASTDTSTSHPRGSATYTHGRPRTWHPPPRLAQRVHSSPRASGASCQAQVAESEPPSRHPFTRRHRRGVPRPPFRRCRSKLSTTPNLMAGPPLAPHISHTLALYHSPPRRRNRQAAAERHWRSRRPTTPATGIVEHPEQPTVLNTT